MVYNYYMKNNLFRSAAFLAAMCLLPALAAAQITVVRVDGTKVYLDISAAQEKIQPGQVFKVILSSEKLINPKTGKNLGDIYQYSAEGKVTEVQPLYAVGEMPKGTTLSVGQEAVFSPAPAPVPAAPAQGPKAAPELRKKTIYSPVDQTLISVSQAAVTAPQAHNFVTLSEDGEVTVWDADAKHTLTPRLTYQVPASFTPITLSALPVKEGLAQIFVTVYSPSRKAISTLVLENQDGKLDKTTSLPFFVKELGCGADKTLWAQTPFVSAERPGNARLVSYQDGKYTVAKDGFSTQRNWLTGLTRYPVEKAGSDNLIYTSSNGPVRVVLDNGKRAESEDLFATAPNRVKYKQEILEFYPSVQAFGPQGAATVAAAENTTKLGLLSKMFGQYDRGRIHFMKFENGRLSVTDTTPLDGVVYDTACSDRAVLAVEVLPDGQSSIVEIFK